VEILVFNYQPENLYFLSAMVDFHNHPSIASATFNATIFIKPKSVCEINIDNKNRTQILTNYKAGISETQQNFLAQSQENVGSFQKHLLQLQQRVYKRVLMMDFQNFLEMVNFLRQ
jgi:hypothetical protein